MTLLETLSGLIYIKSLLILNKPDLPKRSLRHDYKNETYKLRRIVSFELRRLAFIRLSIMLHRK